MKTTLFAFAAAAAMSLLASPAFANECPGLIQKATEMSKSMNLDEAMITKVTEHIALAQTQHDAGKHDEAVATIADANKLMGM